MLHFKHKLKKNLYLHPAKHELLNKLLNKPSNQTKYLENSTKKVSQIYETVGMLHRFNQKITQKLVFGCRYKIFFQY